MFFFKFKNRKPKNLYKMKRKTTWREISAENILLTEEVVVAWSEMARRFGLAVVEVGIDPQKVEDETFWLSSKGSLEIRAKTRQDRPTDKALSIKMKVPKEHWSFSHNN